MSEAVRIEQEASFLTTMLSMVRTGRAVPADFQRPYVWTESDVEAMWESILKGYPLGAFLLWKPAEGSVSAYARPSLGPIPLTEDRHSKLILDGQNRLVSLAWSMTPFEDEVSGDTPGFHFWRTPGRVLVADPVRKRVRFAPRKVVGQELKMPVSSLFDNHLKHRFLRERWGGDDAQMPAVKWLDDLSHKLASARIVITTISNATPAEAIDAFLHIARAGVPVTRKDLAAAFAMRA